MSHLVHIGWIASIVAHTAGSAMGSVTTFFDDHTGWSSLAGPTSAVDFVSPTGESMVIPSDYYGSLGLTLSAEFVGGPWYIYKENPGASTDGWAGIPSGFDPCCNPGAFSFAAPIHAVGFDAPLTSGGGSLELDFYLGSTYLGTFAIEVPLFIPPGPHFFGYVTDFAFDRVVLEIGGADNVYFQAIPAPPASFILLFWPRARRQRD